MAQQHHHQQHQQPTRLSIDESDTDMKRAAIQLALTRVPSLVTHHSSGGSGESKNSSIHDDDGKYGDRKSSIVNADYDTLIGPSLARNDRNIFGMFAHHDIRHLTLAYLWLLDFTNISCTCRSGHALTMYHIQRTYQLTHCATPHVPMKLFTLPRQLKSIYMETPNPFWPAPPIDLIASLIVANRATLRTFALAGSHYRNLYFGPGQLAIIHALTGCRQLRAIALPNMMPKDITVPLAQKMAWSNAVVDMLETTPELEVLDFECSHVLTAYSLEQILALGLPLRRFVSSMFVSDKALESLSKIRTLETLSLVCGIPREDGPQSGIKCRPLFTLIPSFPLLRTLWLRLTWAVYGEEKLESDSVEKLTVCDARDELPLLIFPKLRELIIRQWWLRKALEPTYFCTRVPHIDRLLELSLIGTTGSGERQPIPWYDIWTITPNLRKFYMEKFGALSLRHLPAMCKYWKKMEYCKLTLPSTSPTWILALLCNEWPQVQSLILLAENTLEDQTSALITLTKMLPPNPPEHQPYVHSKLSMYNGSFFDPSVATQWRFTGLRDFRTYGESTAVVFDMEHWLPLLPSLQELTIHGTLVRFGMRHDSVLRAPLHVPLLKYIELTVTPETHYVIIELIRATRHSLRGLTLHGCNGETLSDIVDNDAILPARVYDLKLYRNTLTVAHVQLFHRCLVRMPDIFALRVTPPNEFTEAARAFMKTQRYGRRITMVHTE